MLRSVLMVSKPVAPPWNDSGKNLVRDLARNGERYSYRLLTTRTHARAAAAEGTPRLAWEPLYAATGLHAPALTQNLRVLARLLGRNDTDLRHFFFAPNPRTSRAARLACTLRRGPTVQTVMSASRADAPLAPLVFADRVVALSEWSRQRLVEAGVEPSRLALISPGVELPPRDSTAREAVRAGHGLGPDPVVLYAGDYEFSRAARTLAESVPRVLTRLRERGAAGATFLYACRLKTPAARDEEARVRAAVAEAGCAERVLFRNEVEDMPSLAGACDLCVLPAESLYAKMDLPLVLLEAMARAVPLVVADVDPLREIVGAGGGIAVPPRDAEALAHAIADLLADPEARARMGEEARRAVEARFDARDAARRHEDLYDQILERRAWNADTRAAGAAPP